MHTGDFALLLLIRIHRPSQEKPSLAFCRMRNHMQRVRRHSRYPSNLNQHTGLSAKWNGYYFKLLSSGSICYAVNAERGRHIQKKDVHSHWQSGKCTNWDTILNSLDWQKLINWEYPKCCWRHTAPVAVIHSCWEHKLVQSSWQKILWCYLSWIKKKKMHGLL